MAKNPIAAQRLLGLLAAALPGWLPAAFKGSVFLPTLALCASMMPVDQLTPASWPSARGLGFLSAVFDSIPLRALAFRQGGYDWASLPARSGSVDP